MNRRKRQASVVMLYPMMEFSEMLKVCVCCILNHTNLFTQTINIFRSVNLLSIVHTHYITIRIMNLSIIRYIKCSFFYDLHDWNMIFSMSFRFNNVLSFDAFIFSWFQFPRVWCQWYYHKFYSCFWNVLNDWCKCLSLSIVFFF